MISKALLIRWESQTDEDTMDTFLEDLSAEVTWERTTHAWFGIRYMRGEFGVFTVFHDEAGRAAHLEGKSAQKIFSEVHRLVMTPPKVTPMDVLAYKAPAVIPENSNKGLVLRFKAKAGHEADVGQLLREAKAWIDAEPGTIAWFAVQYDEHFYGLFSLFQDNPHRFAHITGKLPRELAKSAFTLLGGMPEMHLVDVMTGNARTDEAA
jgi:quinol monooxygenase YgiN